MPRGYLNRLSALEGAKRGKSLKPSEMELEEMDNEIHFQKSTDGQNC
jgi:hypothetical protein